MRGCVDGDGEGIAGANHLLGGGYAAGLIRRILLVRIVDADSKKGWLGNEWGHAGIKTYTFPYSKMAGRNFSWMSQTLLETHEPACERGGNSWVEYKRAGFAGERGPPGGVVVSEDTLWWKRWGFQNVRNRGGRDIICVE